MEARGSRKPVARSMLQPNLYSWRRPFTGAWIETVDEDEPDLLQLVAPSQGRVTSLL